MVGGWGFDEAAPGAIDSALDAALCTAGKADLSQESVKTSERLRWLDGVRWREQDLSRTQCKSDSYVFNFKNVLLF